MIFIYELKRTNDGYKVFNPVTGETVKENGKELIFQNRKEAAEWWKENKNKKKENGTEGKKERREIRPISCFKN